jgi:fumarate reductase (CoM/CoB) subunit B
MGDRCLRCNACTINCPITQIMGSDVFPGPRSFNNILRTPQSQELGLLRDALTFCTSCGRCEEVCPQDIEACPIELRKLLFDRTKMALGHTKLLDTVARTGFAVEGDVTVARTGIQEPDVLLFPGCIAGIRMPEVARATVTLLDVFDVSFAIPDGWGCCGSTAAKLGARDLSKQLREKNAEAFERVGAGVIVTPCPGCSSHLWCTCDGYDVYHIVEYLSEVVGVDALAERVAEGHISGSTAPIAVHYPCHVIRGGNPLARSYVRRLAELVARPVDTEDLCCGAGGGVLSGASFVAKALRERKLSNVDGFERLVTACPFCLLNLKEGAEELNLQVDVKDITEVLADIINRS